MSKGYGIDFYGIPFYGYEQPVDYSVGTVTVTQTSYTDLTLNWQPLNIASWQSLIIVKSIYGYVNVPTDATIITTITPSAPYTSYSDTGLEPGKLYYYSFFVSIELAAYDNAVAYTTNQLVKYNNLYWRALQSTTGNAPAAGSAYWSNVIYNPVWYPAGFAAGLTVQNYGYTPRLYARTPQPYKVANSDIFANSVIDNEPLYHYLSLMGYHLDMIKTEYDLYLHSSDPDVISVKNLDILGKQLGFNTDYLSSPQSRRQRVKNATSNYRLKGTHQGIHNLVADITGWDSIVTESNNIMPTADHSAFVSQKLDNWNKDVVYSVGQKIQFNGYDYTCLVKTRGTAQQPTGAATNNTWWAVQIEQLDSTTYSTPNIVQSGSSATGYMNWTDDLDLYYDYALYQPGVYTGIAHPTDSTIKNWHALAFKVKNTFTPPAFVGNTNIGSIDWSTWNNTTNYQPYNRVQYGSNTNYLYEAQKASGPASGRGAVTPGTDDSVWKATPFYTYPLIDTPITPHISAWDSERKYAVGDQTQYFGIIYQAVNDNINSTPTGNYYSNDDWIFIGLPDNGYTCSAYITRVTSNTTSVPVFVDMTFTDGDSFFAEEFKYRDGAVTYLNRFVGDYSDLNGNNDNSLAYLNKPWTASPSTANLWKSSYGMAYTDLTVAGTNTYNLLRYNDTRSDIHLYLTFATDFDDNTHRSHGAFFRWVDNNNFWYFTRQTLYLVQGGVETVMATWPRLQDGDRVRLLGVFSTIELRKYTRDGDSGLTVIANITNTTFATATQHGLITKYSASGAI